MKRYFISILSDALGDTLAWIPYVEEFRKQNNVHVSCCTHWNHLFIKSYPDIQFIEPSVRDANSAEIRLNFNVIDLACFFSLKHGIREVDFYVHPHDYKNQPLQKLAADLLGLNFSEIRPKIDYTLQPNPISVKYVCIATHSTAQCKYWNNPIGWQVLVNYLNSVGYKVLLISKEPDGYNGNKNPAGVIQIQNKSLQEIMNYLYHADFFIGLGSGLSWLNWALEKPTVLISGFSKPYTEMQDCIRVFVPDENHICNGCANDFLFDTDDWNWCPRNRNFECTRSITPQMVIDKIAPLITTYLPDTSP